MANHASAAKRARQSIVRRDRNRSTISALRTVLKKLEGSVEKKDKAAAKADLTVATSYLARAAGKGVLKKNTASRKVSRLTKMVNALG